MVEYTLAYKTSQYYDPVVGQLQIAGSINEKNVTVGVTNTGEYAAQFVQIYALFFNADNQVVDGGIIYVTDSDSEIKPGATVSGQLNAYSLIVNIKNISNYVTLAAVE